MVHRITLVTGGFVATAIMCYAAGIQSAPPPAADSVSAQDVVAAVPQVMPVPAASPQSVTDTVYVLPADEPPVIRVNHPAAPVVVTVIKAPKRTAAPSYHENESESEGAGD